MHEKRKTWVHCLQTSCRTASFTCCLFINTSHKSNSGGHASVYLNWLSMITSNTTRENNAFINEEVNKNCLHIITRTDTYTKHTPYTLALTCRLTEVWGPLGNDNNLSSVMCRASSGDEGEHNMLPSLGLPLRQQCQFLTLATVCLNILWGEANNMLLSVPNHKVSTNICHENIFSVVQ